jgi:hypothetical protein
MVSHKLLGGVVTFGKGASISGGIATLNHRKINTLPKPHPEAQAKEKMFGFIFIQA